VDVRVVTLRYSEAVQGFAEEAVTQATAGREVLGHLGADPFNLP
jgi:hypothetical protein